MLLTGPEIKRRRTIVNPADREKRTDIVIKPFHDECMGTNSYDLHLDKTLKVYKQTLPAGMRPVISFDPERPIHTYSMRDWFVDETTYKDFIKHPDVYDIRNPRYFLDPFDAKSHETIEIEMPEFGVILSPDIGYLGSTVEYTETRNLVPYIDGKSSVGRNFILTHHTAGRGDDGFCGTWTLEIKVIYPTRVRPNMRIAQIYYDDLFGAQKPYDKHERSHYQGQRGPTPAAVIPVENVKQKSFFKRQREEMERLQNAHKKYGKHKNR